MRVDTPEPMLPSDDPGWRSYADTVLEVHGAALFEIDLRQPLDSRVVAGLRAAGLAGCFGLVTPCNPRGRQVAAEENALRMERFLNSLRSEGDSLVLVDGLSPDRQHRETGVALRWPLDRLIELAREWQQSAIYWFDGADFWVIGALTVAAPWRLEPDS